MGGILAYVLIFLVSVVAYIIKKRNNKEPYTGIKLPPGSLGWPYIGETLQLYSQDPNVFFASKQKRFFSWSTLNCFL
jgi:(+)-abscisic acid 8'-hydroxylase